VDIADVTPERLSALKLKEEHGAEVTMVDEDAPAGKAGLHEHDVIVSVNGAAIESAAQLRRIIKETPPGRVVTLGISRDGQPMTIKAQLADRSKSSWKPGEHSMNVQIPEMPSLPDFDLPVSIVVVHSGLRSGLLVENITPQLGDFFGVKDGKGALVRSVEKGSRGEKAGFRAGDVIVKVDGQTVHDASDFTHALRGSSGNTASVTVIRDRHEQNLTLTLPAKKDSGFNIENSFEIPNVSEESEKTLSLATEEVAHLDMKKVSTEMAQASTAFQETQRRFQQRQREMQDRLREQQKQMHRKMIEQQEKMQREFAGEWIEI
jgi:membrane-associated protease RseP (regulator of RpoE activity)